MGVQHTGRALTHWFCKDFVETGGPRNTAKITPHNRPHARDFFWKRLPLSEGGKREGEREGEREGQGGREGGRGRVQAVMMQTL